MRVILVHTPFEPLRPLSTLPHLIRKFDGNFNNHCAIEIDDKIYESDITGVTDVPLHEWARKQTITVYEVTKGDDIHKKWLMNRAKSKVGKVKYDFLSLFVFMPLYLMFGWYIGYSDDRKSAERMYCFEYVAWVFGLSDFYKISPTEFNNWCDLNLRKIYSNIPIWDYLATKNKNN